MAKMARTLLTSKGQLVTWSRTTGGTFDPATGITTGDTTANYSGNGALFEFNTSLINGQSILQTDKQLLLEAGDVPIVNDKITVNGTAYTVIAVKETNPAGMVVMYELQLRS